MYMEEIKNCTSENESTLREGDENAEEERLFDPPLYKQRYAAVAKVINDYSAKFVIDMGCSEGQFLSHVKYFCPSVEKLIGVDIDLKTLELNTNRLRPMAIEYILKRPRPLHMCMYHGSIGNPDTSSQGCDVLVCIEVIEHLFDDVLLKVPESIFGVLKPKVVVITTPNCEYNVLFKNFSGMRHIDHKFEWTRQEFENWCNNIVKKFDYDVEVSGVGEPPADSSVGFCSQMAVFKLKTAESGSVYNEETSVKDIQEIEFLENTNSENVEINNVTTEARVTTETRFKLVKEVLYPYNDINENKKPKVLSEVEYIINQYHSDVTDEMEQYYSDLGEDAFFVRNISINDIFSYPAVKRYNFTKSEFINIIHDKYSLSDDNEYILFSMKLSDYIGDVWSDDEEGEGGSIDSVGDDETSVFVESLEEDWD